MSIYPVRGQMLVLECQERQITHIVNEGPRYIVPRADNFVLVGSTEEDVGFDKQTTESGLADLREFAGRHFAAPDGKPRPGVFARAWPIGSTALWIVVLLIAYIVIYYF